MAEYLVNITVERPVHLDDAAWADLLDHEARVGTSFVNAGVIKRIWRVPGTRSNIGLWEAGDASELHAHLSQLPAFAFMQISVTALAGHYLEAAPASLSPSAEGELSPAAGR